MNILRNAHWPSILRLAHVRASAWTAMLAPVMVACFTSLARAAIVPLQHADAGAVAVPKDPDWAKYVLLTIIWTLVIAAVIGPVYRWLQRKKNPPDMIKYRGW